MSEETKKPVATPPYIKVVAPPVIPQQVQMVGQFQIGSQKYPMSMALAQALALQEKVLEEQGIVLNIKPGTRQMEGVLQAGYQMSVEGARQIIAERTEDPQTHPYDVMQTAKALLEAYEAYPVVTSKVVGWSREVT